MIIGVGIDIVENERVERIFKRFGEKFVHKILTPGEKEDFFTKVNEKNRVQFLAGRWAAKESFWKACGLSFMFKPLSVRIKASGDNFTIDVYSEKVKRILEEKRVEKIFCSISHERKYSVAVVILEGG